MYLYRVTDVCISEGAISYVWREQDGALYIDDYPTMDCSGPSTTAGPIGVGSCSPIGPTAWAQLISVPEPDATIKLVMAVLAGLFLCRRRMRSMAA